ncbi:hypothetical protein QAY_3026 [Clostridioides difficile CD18]|nr:hypothetical protein QAW_3336 [Clostridioides difficile CD17]EQE18680.1 hypothetical protein QAY_3026 [Clostridioides difficile CD18]
MAFIFYYKGIIIIKNLWKVCVYLKYTTVFKLYGEKIICEKWNEIIK